LIQNPCVLEHAVAHLHYNVSLRRDAVILLGNDSQYTFLTFLFDGGRKDPMGGLTDLHVMALAVTLLYPGLVV
jgi:hypothetical protein